MRLPAGQRALVMAKLDDIVNSDDPQLEYAAAQFIELLLVRGLLLDANAYLEIARPAMDRAFEREFEGKLGRRSVREAIAEAADVARGEAFDVLASEFLAFVRRVRLDDKPGWYLQQVRETLQALLANPSCTQGAEDLASALRDVNRIQKRRGQPTGQTSLGTTRADAV
jgi:hypothetical protein